MNVSSRFDNRKPLKVEKMEDRNLEQFCLKSERIKCFGSVFPVSIRGQTFEGPELIVKFWLHGTDRMSVCFLPLKTSLVVTVSKDQMVIK